MFESPPSIAAYYAFLSGPCAFNTEFVTPTSDIIETSYCIARETVNDYICAVAPRQYVEALYNLGADRVINLGTDPPNQTYFSDLRRKYRIGNLSVGVVSDASSQGSSVGQINSDALSQLTLAELQYLKTPYGRQYVAIAMNFGPALFGVSC